MSSQGISASPMPTLGTLSARVSSVCLYLLVFLIPVFYLPWTSNLLEVNKQLVLIVLSVIGGLSWLGSMLASKELVVRRTFLNVSVIAYLAVFGISAWFSQNPTMSFFGYEGNQYTSFLGLTAFVVTYFLVANSARTVKSARMLFGSFLLSSFAALVVGVFSLYGIAVPGASGNFNTIGSIFSLGVFAATILLLVSGFLLIESKEHAGGLMPVGKWGIGTKVFLWTVAALSLFICIALDFWVVSLMLVVGSLVLLGFGIAYPKDFPDMSKFVAPLLVLVVALLLLWIPSPIRLNLPTEVAPSLQGSWTIAKSALKADPLLGSGPGTFAYDYAQHHDKSVNDSMFWNLRFDRANSHAMTLLATTGVFGIVAFLLLILAVLVRGLQFVMKTQEREPRHMALVLLSVFAGIVVSKFLYASNLALEFVFWFVLGLIAVAISDATMKKSFPEAPRMSLLLSFCFVLLLVVGVGFTYLTAQHYAADVIYTQALQSDREGKLEDALAQLNNAASLDTSNDAYFRNLSQANLLMISKEAEKKAKDDSEKQQIARNILNLASLSVNSALVAKNIAPQNVANWSQLAYIYQNISPFTENALEEALKSYQEALKLEPANPVYSTQIGRIYLAKSDEARQKSADKDTKVADEAKKTMADYLSKAEGSFQSAIGLKGDYAPAHYNLALTYDRQGNVKEAIAKMENVRALSPQDVGVLFQLGLLYYRDGQKDTAEQKFENALTLNKDFSNAIWYLATIAEEKGNTAKAIELVKRVLVLNPDDALVKARLEKLQGGKADKPAPKELPQPLDTPKGSAQVGE